MPYVVVQDADLEYDPRDYSVLLPPLLEDRADVVFGSRFHNSAPHRVLYYWHSVGNRLLTTLSNMSTNLNLTDMETCYKVFRREVLQASISSRTASASSRRSPPRSPAARRGASTRSRSATRAAPTKKARRSAGRTASARSAASREVLASEIDAS